MHERNGSLSLDRRRFLQQTAAAAVLAGTIGISTKGIGFAATLKGVKPDAAKTLTMMARDLYPHDGIPDPYYQNAVVAIDAKLAEDEGSRFLLSEGVTALDQAAAKLKGKPYAMVAAEPDRVEVLRSVEETPFFQKVRAEMITAFYNQPEVWAKLGYPGSSWEEGGYLERGFNDIDWLQA